MSSGAGSSSLRPGRHRGSHISYIPDAMKVPHDLYPHGLGYD